MAISEDSDRLMREVSKIKKLIVDREKDKKRNNIVIKGIKKEETEYTNLKDWVGKFLKDKIEVDCNFFRWSGKVIIAKVKVQRKKQKL